MTRLLLAFVGLLLPISVFAQCESRQHPEYSEFQWIAMTKQFYTVCYDRSYRKDADFVAHWIDESLRLGFAKYNIATPVTKGGERLDLMVFLPPEPTQATRRGRVVNICCWSGGLAELHYLTPAAWGSPPFGGLRYENANDYHAHYVVHEMMNLLHYSLESSGQLESWMREGLAEYDGYFHTTQRNQTTVITKLINYVDQGERSKIFCCETLEGSGVSSSSPYLRGRCMDDFSGRKVRRRSSCDDI